MARTLALALALVATDAFIPGTTLRQRVAPVRMVADYLSTMSPSATGTKPKGDYLSSAPTTAPVLFASDTHHAAIATVELHRRWSMHPPARSLLLFAQRA